MDQCDNDRTVSSFPPIYFFPYSCSNFQQVLIFVQPNFASIFTFIHLSSHLPTISFFPDYGNSHICSLFKESLKKWYHAIHLLKKPSRVPQKWVRIQTPYQDERSLLSKPNSSTITASLAHWGLDILTLWES